MNRLTRKIGVVSASALMVAALALPASAATIAPGASSGAHVVLARWHGHHRHHDRVYIRQGHPYWHGHRGYRHHRRGYREYNGYWFPPAAFIAGAIIGGAAVAGSGGSSAHVRWCENHYRSYRLSDDTFQPYSGPRQRCVSPYD